MTIKQSDYESLLCEYTHREGALGLLKQIRPYLEMIPSLRRPEASLITIPLPLVRLRHAKSLESESLGPMYHQETIHLPCDLAILMCDPEWKVKMGSEIVIFIHRPQEEFSSLLLRWRKTQICLDMEYEWLMPLECEDMFSERAERICPLFVVFEQTPDRIKRGLTGANLPFLIQRMEREYSFDEGAEVFSTE